MGPLFDEAGSLPGSYDILHGCYIIIAGRYIPKFRCFIRGNGVIPIVAVTQRLAHPAMNRIQTAMDHCKNEMTIAWKTVVIAWLK
jgi:hypothetical protein